MAEGHQRLEVKQISGQVITHTIVKPIRGESAPPENEAALVEEMDKENTPSE
ncbi:hypothetical protein [Streptomyces rubellomurinus]|uniref:hypothetical protein n=1 Tax=Streptomyces rubellomurinus (strain ATCC 31215) TaxID=359131 RepID=UPI000A9C77E9|nr:hypothetical protein [Streptomyces rubellomurinus]